MIQLLVKNFISYWEEFYVRRPFLILHTKKEERKGQQHDSAQATAAPFGRFSYVSLPSFAQKLLKTICLTNEIVAALQHLVIFAMNQTI